MSCTMQGEDENLVTSWLSAPLASTPVKNKPSGDIPGRKLCQRGSPVTNSASPAIVNGHHITDFVIFCGGKMFEISP